MAKRKSSIGVKTTLKVNLVLIVFLVLGAFGIKFFQDNSLDELITMEEKTLEQELLKRGVLLSQVGSKAIAKIIEEAIDNTAYSVTDFFDTEYQEIPGFDPPKYHTRVDSYFDKAMLALLDEFLKDSDIIYAVAVDRNGYVPTHNTRYQKPLTGDKEKDRVGNRTKQIFNDPIGIKASRNEEIGLRQIYHRDTGEVIWDISSPIMVKGKHWGGFRVGVGTETIIRAKKAFGDEADEVRTRLQQTQQLVMVGILVISLVSVFVTITLALRPLKALTSSASDLADGKMDVPIQKKSNDELGQMADVLERLRLSLKKSMEMLRKKTS